MELKLNAGDVITIPDGCRAVVKDKIIAIEKEVQEFKDGDFVSFNEFGWRCLMIYKSTEEASNANYYHAAMYNRHCKNSVVCYDYWSFCYDSRIATEEEKQLLLDALHADGKDWDADKREIVDYKWKPKVGDTYYYIDCFFNVVDDHWSDGRLDNSAYNNGNCFKTEEEAQKYADKFSEILKERKL